MFFKFCPTRKFSLPLPRLGSCRLYRVLPLAVVTVAIGMFPQLASANPIVSPPFYSIAVLTDCLADIGCSTFSFANAPGAVTSPDGTSSARATSVPHPTLTSQAQNGLDSSSVANGGLSYEWFVAGLNPDDHSSIPILISYSLSVTASAGARASGFSGAHIDAGGEHHEVNAADCSAESAVNCVGVNRTDSDSGTISFSAIAGELQSLGIGAIATAVADCKGINRIPGVGACDGSSVAFVMASADPVISIDPGFLASHPGYSIVLSDGIGNEADALAVPEPGSIALLGLGLAGLGFMRRRRAA